ncbi:Rv2175c family DNA-binding protein [Mobilicoccus caccae]|uniref:Rv2175c family DNA-binding protein n=1 Tax=Mobilicoccus caccae TaxID=1859295 RepID=UPI0024E0CE97|nr:Rv2175c family DNA-binding protein [Mobilicoccus caccae]
MNEQLSSDPDGDDRRAALESLVDAWVSVPEAAELQGRSLSTVRGQLKDRELVGVRRGPNNAVYIPAAFLTSEGPVSALHGTVTVLADGGMDDLELLTWLFTAQDGLAGDGTPIGALLTGHNKAEVRRRAMETAF